MPIKSVPREIKELYRLELFPRLYRLQLFRELFCDIVPQFLGDDLFNSRVKDIRFQKEFSQFHQKPEEEKRKESEETMKNLKEGKFVIKSIPIILDNESPYTDVEKKEARDDEAKCLIDDFITLEQYLGAQKTFDDDVNMFAP